ncbi:MAG: hypothetical protein AAFV51_02075 [Pseudomonadota bacterium]
MAQPADAALFEEIAAKGRVGAEDVLALRRAVYPDGVISEGEIKQLFTLAARVPDGDPDWGLFFEEACLDRFLKEEEPSGHLTVDEFAALKEVATENGRVPNRFILETLVALLCKAKRTPPAMTTFLARELVGLIAEKKPAPVVTAEDAALFKRFVYGPGGAGTVAVPRDEAEFLLEVEAVARNAANAPEWGALFAQALSAHLMQHVDAEPNTRAEDLRLKAFVDNHSVNPVGFLLRMLKGGLSGFRRTPDEDDEAAAREAERQRAAADAEVVTGDEGAWLAERLGSEGRLSVSEIALMQRLKDLGAPLPEPLKPFAEAS